MRPIVTYTLLCAALSSPGCRTMKPVSLEQLTTLGPDRVWVTVSDQSVVLMYEPKVVGDTLVGYIGKQRGRLPGAGVKHLRVQTSAPTRTALLAAGGAAALAGFLVVVAGSGQSQAPTTTISVLCVGR